MLAGAGGDAQVHNLRVRATTPSDVLLSGLTVRADTPSRDGHGQYDGGRLRPLALDRVAVDYYTTCVVSRRLGRGGGSTCSRTEFRE